MKIITSILVLFLISGVIGISGCTDFLKSNTDKFLKTNKTNNTTQTSVQISESSGFPVSEAPNLAAELSMSNGTTQSIEFKGVNLDKNQCFYILSRAIVMINTGENGYIPIKQISNAAEPMGYLNSAALSKNEYVDMADRTYKWMDANGQVPNYVGIVVAGSPDLSPDLVYNAFIKVLTQYKSTGTLPQSISVP